jgi:DNA-binding IclR family transcriptional regulator
MSPRGDEPDRRTAPERVILPESLFVARTMQALELLALHPLSAPQVAEALHVHPRTARRLLRRLAEDGWLTCSDDARRVYAPTLKVVALAGHVLERSALAEAGAGFVAALRDETGAPAHLVIPSYRWVLCIAHGEGDEPVRAQLREVLPCHATATGKILLAHRDAWRDSVLAGPLPRLTARTVTDPEALRRETGAARRRGYAVEDGEWRADVRAVAAPVFDHTGEAVAALGSAVPPGAAVDPLAQHVVATARELSAVLGSDRG